MAFLLKSFLQIVKNLYFPLLHRIFHCFRSLSNKDSATWRVSIAFGSWEMTFEGNQESQRITNG
ncbi:Pyrophosphate--fructose 6-phosphate 1-phosphotransferase subunit alpha [Olea europaea subsp. europaea]|uniref:Pyrophosphate--fructose 6-phosphate 1-phosphotransferase subunit alpha n=1 Tax=Olea europaea subsp. europaea TaxID=158383 RepID=A0A8S0RWC9_OLEEU|nr:Pyrophosphate--fructose 6-phosphate 1-phosphotransferase subunit alpha [Olea europaea subsp. europaea]